MIFKSADIHPFIIIFMKLGLAFILFLFLCCSFPILALSYFAGFFSLRLQIQIAKIVCYTTWSILNIIFGLTCSIEEKSIPKGNYVVISNHINAIDFVLINRLNKYNFSDAKYAFKRSLICIPIFYQTCVLLKFLVLYRNFETDRCFIEKHINDLKKYLIPVWFILFCEGTRFTRKKHQESVKFCKEKGITPFTNVLCPRHKGFSILIDNLRNSYIKKVLDLTFYCKDETFSLYNMLFTAKKYNFKMDYRLVDIDSIHDTKEFLEESFRRKDRIINDWKKMDQLD